MSSFFNIIKNKVNILNVIQNKIKLKKYGKDYIGLCPFHNEKTPSFRVNNVKNFFYCFGCSTGGDVISFIAKINNMQYKMAALKLAKDYNIPIPTFNQLELDLNKNKKSIANFLETVNDYFISNLFASSQAAQFALQYLLNRNINLQEIKNYQFGLSNNKLKDIFFNNLKELAQSGLIAKSESGEIYEVFRNRLMIPIRNQYNNLIAFGGRSLDDKMPKYLNSPEILIFKKNEALYGENIAFNYAYKDNYILLVEGYFDCITLQINGYLNTVASLGTAVTLEHLNKIWNKVEEIIICMDSDTAGIKATKRIIDIAISKINCSNLLSFIYLPKGYDPDSFIREHGKLAFNELLNKKETLSEIIWKFEIKDNIISSAEDFAKLNLRIDNICNKILDPIIKKNFISFFKTKIWELHKLKFINLNLLKNNKAHLKQNHKQNNIEYNKQNNIQLNKKFNQYNNNYLEVLKFNNIKNNNEITSNNYKNINLEENDIIEFAMLNKLIQLLQVAIYEKEEIFFSYYENYFCNINFSNLDITTLQNQLKQDKFIQSFYNDLLSKKFLIQFKSIIDKFFSQEIYKKFSSIIELGNITNYINSKENLSITNYINLKQNSSLELSELNDFKEEENQQKIYHFIQDLEILKLKHQLIL
ncbi:MAG: DNA primase, partial [Rickettsiales bacterium]